jgi:hypothetical protein
VKLGEIAGGDGQTAESTSCCCSRRAGAEVWTDITRMLTLNGAQAAKGKEMHLCPMQFDLADRVIEQIQHPGRDRADPFGGLMTVPYRAIKRAVRRRVRTERALLRGRRNVLPRGRGRDVDADALRCDGAATTKPAQWGRKSRPRNDQAVCNQAKFRWETP